MSLTFWAVVGLLRLMEEHSSRSRPLSISFQQPSASGIAGEWPALLAGLLVLAAAVPAVELGAAIAIWVRLVGGGQLAMLVGALVSGLVCWALVSLRAAEAKANSRRDRWLSVVEAALWTVLFLAIAAIYLTVENRIGSIGRSGIGLVAPFLAVLGLASIWLGLRSSRAARAGLGPKTRIGTDEVAVLIPAHNEEATLAACIDAVSKIVRPCNIFVGSDASTDRTVEIARSRGCQVADIRPSRGKARVLKYLIDKFEICRRYKAVMLLDADSEPDPSYLARALPLFDDGSVVAIAGHVLTRWETHAVPRWSMFFVAYRVRLYRLLQALTRYGQTWKRTNVAYIVPGFASMYRTSVLPKIDIAAPGLIIEDFNMTFELHRLQLGRIAYHPDIRCVSRDPLSLRDYVKQVKRWNLGFWQTVRRNGIWLSAFWLSLAIFLVELLLVSLFFVLLPIQIGLGLIFGQPMWSISIIDPSLSEISSLDLLIGILAVDYAITVVVAWLERKPILLVYGLGFPILRGIDAALLLYGFVASWFVHSDGRWVSPARV